MTEYQEICSIWKSFDIQEKSQLENHLDSFKVLFAYHSSKIENEEIKYDDTREIFEKGSLTSYTGDVTTVFELQNQKICYDFLLDKILAKEPLSVELIKTIHKKLARGTYDDRRYHVNQERPGQYKKHDYVTGPKEIGLPPEEVSGAMEDLVRQVNENSQHTLVAAAYLHAWFEYIHAFADANGRAGRTIMNYFLLINDHPPVVIRNEEKREYLEALRTFDETESLDPLLDFLKGATVTTWRRLLKGKEVTKRTVRSLSAYL